MKRTGIVLAIIILLFPACSKGPVLIRSEPPRAYISVNGVNQGVTPLELDLDCDEENSFEIVASAPGYLAQQETITCPWIRGLKNNVFFELEPGVEQVAEIPGSPGEVIEQYGTLDVKSVPAGAKVFVNSMYVGDTPLLNKRIGSGTYTVEVRKDGFRPEARTARVAPDLQSSHFIILESN